MVILAPILQLLRCFLITRDAHNIGESDVKNLIITRLNPNTISLQAAARPFFHQQNFLLPIRLLKKMLSQKKGRS